MIHVFGIRHHGPGSAKSLKKALTQLAPDCIVIECPADAEGVIPYVANENLKPPVAILQYNPKLLTQATYIPFAEFSPEWQALKYAVKREIPVRCMDLPMSLNFTLDREEKENTQLNIEATPSLDAKGRAFRKDPMAYMAEIAGYQDSERWWEVTFESSENETAIFQSILEIMTALRESELKMESTRSLQREAYMRKVIRKAIKEGFQNIAVVCGAWHAPVLHDLSKFKQSADNAILRGIKKTSTKATWVPWSYDRLTYLSGYGAGILSPAWYALLFSNRKEVAIRWMIKVARLFRKEDLDASSAHVIEAVRLSNTLATMRGLSIAGIDEMKQAAISIFCNGDESQLSLIEQKLIIGKKVGNVPPEIPSIPLQQDIEKTVKTARLSSYWKNTDDLWLKATAANPRGGIDLREEKDRLKSHLLHRLHLLGIPWGKLQKDSERDLGSFKEYWKLKWKPDFSIKIIEAGMWGNTLYQAATNYLKTQIIEIKQLPILTELTEKALHADLNDAIDSLIEKLQNLAALTKEVQHLMNALPNLVNIIRYGNVRKTDMASVKAVVAQLIPRICIGLPTACMALDETATEAAFNQLLKTHQALNLLNDPAYLQLWYQAIQTTKNNTAVEAKLAGICTRILFDKQVLGATTIGNDMRLALSKTNKPAQSAAWLEGFLYGSGLLLIHNLMLWNLLDEWIDEIKYTDFEEILPVLRRTFANFPAGEKQKMLEMAKYGATTLSMKMDQKVLDEERVKEVLPVVQLLLGMR